MIQKHPGQIELFRNVLGERFDADGLGCVVPRIKDVDAKLLSIEKGPVLPFSGDVGVESRGCGLWDQCSTCPGDDTDAVHALGAERKYARCRSQCLRQRPTQLLALTGEFAPDADRGSVIRPKLAAHGDSQQPPEYGVVADDRMTIERKVRSVERNVSFDESSNSTIGGTDQRPETTPKHSVMDQETVGVLLHGLSNCRLAQVHGSGQTADVAGVADLEAVQRLGRVSDLLGDAEVVVKEPDQTV